MLYLDSPIGPINGLMIYRDHQDPDMFYYVPERPRLALNDGTPEFVFLKYRRDITDNADFDPDKDESLGGGFLAFTVDLGVTDEQLDDMKRELRRFADGDIKLAPIQFRKGSVRLSISKDAADADGAAANEPRGLTFFEEVYGTSKPSLFGFNRATFSLILSREGATLFETALRAGISPVGVIYDLEFLGLRPAFNVHITADYRRIYDHLEVEFGARGQIQMVSLAAEIAAAFQKLRDEGHIKVEVINFSDDEDLRKQADDAFKWFQQELLKEFFQSALEPPSFMTRSNNGGMLGQLQNLFGALNAVQSAPATPQRGTPTATAPTAAPAATDLSSGERSTTEMNRTAATAGGGGMAAAGTNNPASEISPIHIGFSLKYYHQDELKIRTFDYSMQTAVASQAAPQGLFSTITAGLDPDRAIKEVDLDDDFFTRLVATVSLGGDLDVAGITAVGVNLEYPGNRAADEEPTHVDGFVFRPTELTPQTFNSWLNDAKDLTYRYQLDIHFKPDSPWVGKEAHVVSPWRTSRARQLTLNPLDEIGLLDVEVTLGEIDAADVSQVQVELLYDDTANEFHHEKTMILRPGEASRHWRLRLSDPELRSYQYRLTYFMANNLRVVQEWQTADDETLVVNEPFQGLLSVRLVPLLDAEELLEAVVDITYHEDDSGYTRHVQQVFTPDALRSQTIQIPTLAAEPISYSYETTVIRLDGSVFVGEPQTAVDRALVISDGVGSTNRIRVKLPSATLNGLAALKVDLESAGETPDRDSALFTPSQLNDALVSLVSPNGNGSFAYHYTVTGYTALGQPVAGLSGDTSDKTLIVQLPTA
ncbi:MAG: hypothetical protein KC423_00365 [Anaerolineales bacterium]|nr:hypothetical protein [Anaerolineales bacterium]